MEFKKTISERRSVNFFDPAKPVSDAELRNLVEIAARAPSSFNLQPWQLIVVRSPEDKERLKAVSWNQAKITEAPVILIVLADRSGWESGHPTVEKVWKNMVDLGYMKPEQRDWFNSGTQFLYGGNEKSLSFAVKNAAFFSMYLMLAAKDAGLDTHSMDGFDHEGVRKTFNIPDTYFVPLLMAVGHFNKQHKLIPSKWRKSYDEIVWKQY